MSSPSKPDDPVQPDGRAPQDQQPHDREWTLVACGNDPETGKRRCTYTWVDGTRETFVEGEHPIHRKGLGRAARLE